VDKTDEQLARGATEGDLEAFEALVERFRAPVIGHVTGLIGRRAEAEELAQETFLIVWQKIRGLRDPSRVSGWIYRIAGRLAKRQARARQPVPLADDPPAPGVRGEEPSRVVSLLAAVARLSGPHRDVISRKHFAGSSGDEIGRQLGIASGTVRSRLSRAYAELRALLADEKN
jgi:RNA polymerase sigma-70 factor (ECF subfamily)